jgi:hypothetical protein
MGNASQTNTNLGVGTGEQRRYMMDLFSLEGEKWSSVL